MLLFPQDIFKLEYGDYGTGVEQEASYDLQQAGFLVFQVNHRLAPMGALIGHSPYPSGQAPTQTDDAKRQILAALADSQCNGSIYLIGGSAGGTLVLWVMLDTAGGVNLAWNDTVRSHIKAVVSLSGPTDFCDWSNPVTLTAPISGSSKTTFVIMSAFLRQGTQPARRLRGIARFWIQPPPHG